MNYLKKLFNSIIPIIIYMIINYLLIFIGYFIYSIFDNDMNNYINNYSIYIVLIFNIIYIFILLKKYNIHLTKSKNKFELILLGISISSFCNMIIININPLKEVNDVNIILLIISSVITGPIVEELLFRNILINKLRKFNNNYITILLSSLIFSLMHNGIINIIYTFILGLILSSIYIKKRKILDTILVHSFANLISIFLTGFNNYILLLSFILLLESVYILKRNYFNL